MLTTELLRMVGWHVRPRHFWKLLCCCKNFLKVFDMEDYWLKLAIFLHARYFIQ